MAERVGVSPAAVGHWESGAASPRSDHVARLADLLDVPPAYLATGRRYVRLDAAAAHFRKLRSTPASLRAKAIAFTEQVWEFTYALERRVQLPPVELPGFAGGEVQPGDYAGDPVSAAQYLRRQWELGTGPIPHLVRTMERHRLIVTLVPFAGAATKTVDAFSTSHLPRPVVVLTPDRADEVFEATASPPPTNSGTSSYTATPPQATPSRNEKPTPSLPNSSLQPPLSFRNFPLACRSTNSSD